MNKKTPLMIAVIIAAVLMIYASLNTIFQSYNPVTGKITNPEENAQQTSDGDKKVYATGITIPNLQLSPEMKTQTPSKKCTDSDSNKKYPTGKNPFKNGTTKIENLSKTDYCLNNSQTLKEFYCDANISRINSQVIDCKDFGDYKCINDACINTKNSENCVDTDEGLDVYKKGSVITKDGTVFTDVCIGDKIKEYYCQREQQRFIIWSCKTLRNTASCSDGACKEN